MITVSKASLAQKIQNLLFGKVMFFLNTSDLLSEKTHAIEFNCYGIEPPE